MEKEKTSSAKPSKADCQHKAFLLSGAHHRLICGSWWEPAAEGRRDARLVELLGEIKSLQCLD